LKEKVNAKELFKQFLMTVVETGMPYVFFRDTANRFNPNNHC
jgi:ribonucleoside-diphosphate reductase alpha chain